MLAVNIFDEINTKSRGYDQNVTVQSINYINYDYAIRFKYNSDSFFKFKNLSCKYFFNSYIEQKNYKICLKLKWINLSQISLSLFYAPNKQN